MDSKGEESIIKSAGIEENGQFLLFLKNLEKRIESLYTTHDKDISEFDYCLKDLCDGCEKGDPFMMFLGARFADFEKRGDDFYSTSISWDFDSWKLKESPFQEAYPWLEDHEIKDLYIRAAESDSLHALLWCAWCYAEERAPFTTDPEQSQRYLERAAFLLGKEGPHFDLAEFLSIKELADFFAEQLEKLDAYAFDVEIEESAIIGLDPEYYPAPDPSSRVLLERLIDLQKFARAFGIPTETRFRSVYGVSRDLSNYNIDTERSWVAWCLEALGRSS